MPTRRSGFTLIELLIVVVIIGILAASAIPEFNTTKGKANLSAIRSDLHNIAVAQEAYSYDNSRYANEAELAFQFSPGVRSVAGTPITGTTAGWSAKITHDQSFPLTCALFVGSVPSPPAPAVVQGVMACN